MSDEVAASSEGDRIYAAFMHAIVPFVWVFGWFAAGYLMWIQFALWLVPIMLWLAQRNNLFIFQQGKNLTYFLLTATLLHPMIYMFVVMGFVWYSGDPALLRYMDIFAESDMPNWMLISIAAMTVQVYEPFAFVEIFILVFTVMMLLRPVIAPIRGAIRAYQGKTSDYD